MLKIEIESRSVSISSVAILFFNFKTLFRYFVLSFCILKKGGNESSFSFLVGKYYTTMSNLHLHKGPKNPTTLNVSPLILKRCLGPHCSFFVATLIFPFFWLISTLKVFMDPQKFAKERIDCKM